PPPRSLLGRIVIMDACSQLVVVTTSSNRIDVRGTEGMQWELSLVGSRWSFAVRPIGKGCYASSFGGATGVPSTSSGQALARPPSLSLAMPYRVVAFTMAQVRRGALGF